MHETLVFSIILSISNVLILVISLSDIKKEKVENSLRLGKIKKDEKTVWEMYTLIMIYFFILIILRESSGILTSLFIAISTCFFTVLKCNNLLHQITREETLYDKEGNYLLHNKEARMPLN